MFLVLNRSCPAWSATPDTSEPRVSIPVVDVTYRWMVPMPVPVAADVAMEMHPANPVRVIMAPVQFARDVDARRDQPAPTVARPPAAIPAHGSARRRDPASWSNERPRPDDTPARHGSRANSRADERPAASPCDPRSSSSRRDPRHSTHRGSTITERWPRPEDPPRPRSSKRSYARSRTGSKTRPRGTRYVRARHDTRATMTPPPPLGQPDHTAMALRQRLGPLRLCSARRKRHVGCRRQHEDARKWRPEQLDHQGNYLSRSKASHPCPWSQGSARQPADALRSINRADCSSFAVQPGWLIPRGYNPRYRAAAARAHRSRRASAFRARAAPARHTPSRAVPPCGTSGYRRPVPDA